MARSKRASRAEARRRHREQQRVVEGDAPVAAETAAESGKPPSLVERIVAGSKLPDVGADVRALPTVARHSWALAVPLAAVVVAFGLGLEPSVYSLTAKPDDPLTLVAGRLLFQFVLLPPPVTPVFLAGVLAPRASWLVGGIVGVASSIAFLGLLTIHGPAPYFQTQALAAEVLLSYIPIYVLLGGFSGWYRRWLVGRQRQTRQAAEERRRAKSREQRRDRTATARR